MRPAVLVLEFVDLLRFTTTEGEFMVIVLLASQFGVVARWQPDTLGKLAPAVS